MLGRVADIIGSKKAFVLGFILIFAALLLFMIPVKMLGILFLSAGIFDGKISLQEYPLLRNKNVIPFVSAGIAKATA